MTLKEFLDVCSEFDSIQLLDSKNEGFIEFFENKKQFNRFNLYNCEVVNIQIDSDMIENHVESEFTIFIEVKENDMDNYILDCLVSNTHYIVFKNDKQLLKISKSNSLESVVDYLKSSCDNLKIIK